MTARNKNSSSSLSNQPSLVMSDVREESDHALDHKLGQLGKSPEINENIVPDVNTPPSSRLSEERLKMLVVVPSSLE